MCGLGVKPSEKEMIERQDEGGNSKRCCTQFDTKPMEAKVEGGNLDSGMVVKQTGFDKL